MNSKIKSELKNYIMITLATILISAGVYFFKFPNNFSTGGVAGVAIILAKIFPVITVSTYSMIINLSLLLLGFIFVGKSFAIKTAYASALHAILVYIFELIFPLSGPLTDDAFLELVYTIMIAGFGSALLFNYDASGGGTDIIAMIIKKYKDVNISKALFYADVVILMAVLFVFDLKTWLFSLVAFLAKIFILNTVIKGFRLSKFCTIIVKPECIEQVCDYITNTLRKSATVSTNYEGAFAHTQKAVILVALSSKDANELKKYIKTLDEHAFIVVTETSEISGRGFRDVF